jgi:hypothetical protein
MCYSPVIGVRLCLNLHHRGHIKTNYEQNATEPTSTVLTSKYASKMSLWRKLRSKWTIFGDTYYVVPAKTIILNSNHWQV